MNWTGYNKVQYAQKDYRFIGIIIIWLNLAAIDSTGITALQPENPLYISSLQ